MVWRDKASSAWDLIDFGPALWLIIATMNVPSYLIIRALSGGVEFLCIDLNRLAGSLSRGPAPPEGIAVRYVTPEEGRAPSREKVTSVFKRMLEDRGPSRILIDKGGVSTAPVSDLVVDAAAGLAAGRNIQYLDMPDTDAGQAPDAPLFPGRFFPWHGSGKGDASSSGPAQPPPHFGIRIPSEPDSDFSSFESRLPGLVDRGLAMIHWQLRGPDAVLPRTLLWQASKQGVWNHVSGKGLFKPAAEGAPEDKTTGGWIANNPNIVHSFENFGPAATSREFIPGSVLVPSGLMTYGRLPDLPGLALWQMVRAPELLRSIVARIGKKELLRLRLDPVSGRLFRLGQTLEYHFKRPDEIRPERMEEIIAMVDAGGSVDITHVRKNLARAYLIGYALEDGIVAGNSSLKHPRRQFIDRLKESTGLDFTRCVERGYTSVRPEYRAMGIGARLLEGLTARARGVKIFSIIGEDNLATQKIAIRNRTKKIAVYFSEKTGKDMGVWMPERMVEDGGESETNGRGPDR